MAYTTMQTRKELDMDPSGTSDKLNRTLSLSRLIMTPSGKGVLLAAVNYRVNFQSRIEIVLILTLISFVDDIPVKESNNCFELYGMDVMIDDNYQPWLLEVNYSPALTIDCATDEIVKRPLVEDLITLLQFKPDTQITPSLSYRKPDVPKQLSTSHMRTNVKSSSLLNPSADSQVFHKEVVGDFAQLFPFNDASRKASKSLDPSGPSSTKPGEAMKIIISQLKKVYNLC